MVGGEYKIYRRQRRAYLPDSPRLFQKNPPVASKQLESDIQMVIIFPEG
jgi:hypothetical protein